MIGVKQIGAGGGGSEMEQDNNDIVKTINTQTSSLSRLVDTITSSVNYIEPYDISETESLWFVFLFTNGVTMRYKLLKKGKGTYGNGGTPITFSELLFISQSQTTVADLENLETTDIIFIEDLQGMTITQYVNQANPTYNIKPKTDGETIFKVGLLDKITYWFVGDSGKYGLGFLQSADLDFQLLDNTDSVANIPVSATQSGVVDNTQLQELGGTDKKINGVRIGTGLGSENGNTVLGKNAMSVVLPAGQYNTAIGTNVMATATTGNQNTSVGSYSMSELTTGRTNVALGVSAMQKMTTGQQNVALGAFALNLATTGTNNIAIGQSAMSSTAGGSANIAIGLQAMAKATASGNIAIGQVALFHTSTGTGNVMLGGSTLNVNGHGISTGSNNILLGPGRVLFTDLKLTTGSNNVIIGKQPVDLAPNTESNVIISDALGNQAFRKLADGTTIVPSQTNASINADLTGKSVLTKEYFESHSIAKNYLQDNILLRAMNYTVNVVTDFPRNNNLIIYGNPDSGDFTITLPSAGEMKGYNVWVYNQGNNGSIAVQGIILNAGKRTSFKSDGLNIYEW